MEIDLLAHDGSLHLHVMSLMNCWTKVGKKETERCKLGALVRFCGFGRYYLKSLDTSVRGGTPIYTWVLGLGSSGLSLKQQRSGLSLKQQWRSAYILVSEVVSGVLKNNFQVCHAIVVKWMRITSEKKNWAQHN